MYAFYVGGYGFAEVDSVRGRGAVTPRRCRSVLLPGRRGSRISLKHTFRCQVLDNDHHFSEPRWHRSPIVMRGLDVNTGLGIIDNETSF
jgi:hypothetical protein